MTDEVAVHTDRVTLTIDGQDYRGWTEVKIERDVENMAGSFSLTCRDDARALAALDFATPDDRYRLRPGPGCTIAIDGEPVLVGYVETVEPSIDDKKASVTIGGRDKTGDLVDCAAAPEGPGEYRDITLADFAGRVAAPFGIGVTSDLADGRPFKRASIETAETAHSAIVGHCRARGALAMSDGVGGLRITQSGADRAPGSLSLPGNMLRSKGRFTTLERFSDVHVKGQGEKAHYRRGTVPHSFAGPAPTPSEPAGSDATDRERAALSASGRARDPEVSRYRPRVVLSRKQPDDISPRDEAEWQMRTARARCEGIDTTVVDWRGQNGGLWRPNQQVSVDDAFQGVNRVMLISGVTYIFNDKGPRTDIRVKSLEAYDLAPEDGRRDNEPGGAP